MGWIVLCGHRQEVEHMGTDGGLLVSTRRLGSCGSPIRLLRVSSEKSDKRSSAEKKDEEKLLGIWDENR